MCGIVGYIGEKDVKEIVLKGLEKLEYRGYDSAGIAIVNDGVVVFKDKGRIENLRSIVDETPSTIGVGHTRWATHGKPNQTNSHPHQSMSGRFTLVHNGVIENETELKNEYLSHYTFMSETDTEVLVNLIDFFVMEKGMAVDTAIRHMMTLIHGSYALGIIDSEDTEVIYSAKNKSPLLLGVGHNFNMIGSDAMAMLHETSEFIEIHDEEFVMIKDDEIIIQSIDGARINRESYTAEIDASDIEKGTYPHYMLKEVDEQPFVMRHIIEKYEKDGELSIDEEILEAVKKAERIYIVAAGTSYNAGLVGKQLIESLGNVPTEVHIASEFVYNTPLISKNPLFLFISQSGETADLRAVLVKVKKLGYKTLTLTNVPGSTLLREADYSLLLHAGPEIAVASTKAYTAQIAVLSILASQLSDDNGFDLKYELAKVANVMEGICTERQIFDDIAKESLTHRNCFYIGRHVDYYVAQEAALKLKEVSYIQTEGFAAGELKHGTIALIENGTPVIAVTSQYDTNLNTRSNIKEVKARGAKTITISMKSLSMESDDVIIDDVHPLLTPLVTVIPTQLIAYYAALHRGCDIDKPRNLAKSVTVE